MVSLFDWPYAAAGKPNPPSSFPSRGTEDPGGAPAARGTRPSFEGRLLSWTIDGERDGLGGISTHKQVEAQSPGTRGARILDRRRQREEEGNLEVEEEEEKWE